MYDLNVGGDHSFAVTQSGIAVSDASINISAAVAYSYRGGSGGCFPAGTGVWTENGLVPIFKKNPEFTAYYLVGGHDDHIATVSVFKSFDAALKSNLEAASWVKENVREFMPEDAQVTSGETLLEVQATG